MRDAVAVNGVVGEVVDVGRLIPRWHHRLQKAPVVRGVKQISPQAIDLSVVLITHAGPQWDAQRAQLPPLAVGYEVDFNGDANEEHQLTASFADVPALGSLDVLGQNRGANDLNVGLSVELETSEQFSLYAGVGGSFWSNGHELNYGGGIRWRFGGAPKAAIAKAPPVAAPTPQAQPAAVETPQLQPTIRGLW